MGEPDGSMRPAQPAVIEGRTMAVLYGTETGQAEEIAVELGKMAERLHFKTTVDEMDSFKLVRHPQTPQTGADAGHSLTVPRTGRCFTHVTSHLCHINNRAGRHAKEHTEVLEKSQARETQQHQLSQVCAIRQLRAR